VSDDVEARVLSVLFRAGGERYAIPAGDVLKVAQCGHVCPAPRLPSCILGVTQLRGRIVTAFDVVTLLDGGARRVINSDHAWLLLLDRGAKNLGLVADAVDEIVPVRMPRRSDASGPLRGAVAHGGNVLHALDTDRLIDRLTTLEGVEARATPREA
jgi:chemotaxis signal transduction protein